MRIRKQHHTGCEIINRSSLTILVDAEVKKLTLLAQLLCTETDEADGCGVSLFPLETLQP